MVTDSVGGRLDGVVPGENECAHPGNNNNHHGSNEGEPTFSDDEEAEENDVEHEVEESEQTAGSLVRTLRRLSQDDDEDEDIPLGKVLYSNSKCTGFFSSTLNRLSLLWHILFTAKVKLKKGKKGNTKNNMKPVLEGELRSAAETLRSQSDNDVK